MEETRRYFLMTLAATASCFVAADCPVFAQTRRTPFPLPPPAAVQQNPAETDPAKQGTEQAKRAALKQNEKEFRAGVSQLYRMASELKQEVDKTPTSDVFSVQMYRRTEEIEKLAKQLKAKAKG